MVIEALAEGEAGGARAWETYILIANPSDTSGLARVTLHYEDGGGDSTTVTVPGHSRRTVDVRGAFPAADGRRFGMVIEALPEADSDVVPGMVVERSMYAADTLRAFRVAFPAGTPYWPAGTCSVGTRLR